MFVYEPGSGFSGEARLVKPGFEWSDLSLSYETSQFHSQNIDHSSEVKIEPKSETSRLEDFVPVGR